jgi:putative aldouronate transport system permease protein
MILLSLLSLTIVFPFWQQIVISVSPPSEASTVNLHLFTLRPTLDAYKDILRSGVLLEAYAWTIMKTAVGTFLSVIVSTMLAYPLSKKYLIFRKGWMGFIIFTMFFGGGLIPTFLLVRDLRLMNTIWALILPGLCSAYTVVIIRNFFMSLPVELEEAAYIDGANEVMVFFRIVLPLSMPIIATVSLWSIVGSWNAWFDALIYLNDNKIKILQIVLRKTIQEAVNSSDVLSVYEEVATGRQYTRESLQAATLMAVTLPVLITYPFLQKYFVKGIMIGSVKG